MKVQWLILGLMMSSAAFANTVSIATGVWDTTDGDPFSAACDAKIKQISDALASSEVVVKKDVQEEYSDGDTSPHCAPDCGPHLRYVTCDAVLTSTQGKLAISTQKIDGKQCDASLAAAGVAGMVYQNIYASTGSFFRPVCVIDTITLTQ